MLWYLYMRKFYSLFLFLLVAFLSLPTRLLGQCTSRPPGSGRYNAIDAGLLTACNPIFTDTKNNSPSNCFGNFFDYGQGGQPSDEIYYKFTLNGKQKVTISHCGSGIDDTFMSLLDSSGKVVAIVDDTTKVSTTYVPNLPSGSYYQAGIQRILAAGTYYIISEGYSSNSGDIRTQISVQPIKPAGATMANAIDAGTLSSCGGLFADTQRNDATSCYGNDYDQSLNASQVEGRPTDDIFYKFTLTSSTEVTLSHCNTGIAFNGREADTYIHLLDANGNHLASNDDYGPACYSGKASIRQTLGQALTMSSQSFTSPQMPVIK